MKALKFRYSIWISIYLTIFPNLFWFASIPAIISLFYWQRGFIFVLKSSIIMLSIPFIPILLIAILPMCFSDCVKIKDESFSVFNTLQLSSSGIINWNDIYKVEPYRYYGLPFFLVWFDRLESPTWLPLFLIKQNKFERIILETTATDNPLNIALLKKDSLLKQVSWHSKPKKKTKPKELVIEDINRFRFYYTARKIYFPSLIIGIIFGLFCIAYTVITDGFIDRSSLILIAIGTIVHIIFAIACIAFIIYDSYIEIKDNGIVICWGNSKSFIAWSEIIKVEYSNSYFYNFLVIKQKKTSNLTSYFNYSLAPKRILLACLNQNKFKSIVIARTPEDNILHQAVIKYL